MYVAKAKWKDDETHGLAFFSVVCEMILGAEKKGFDALAELSWKFPLTNLTNYGALCRGPF